MVSETFERFLSLAVIGTMLAFVAGALVTPPDPLSQVRFLALALPVVVAVAYLVSYRVGVE